jgi:hypothetical protein
MQPEKGDGRERERELVGCVWLTVLSSIPLSARKRREKEEEG